MTVTKKFLFSHMDIMIIMSALQNPLFETDIIFCSHWLMSFLFVDF